MNAFGKASDTTIFAEYALIEGQWRKNTVVTITNSKIASIMCDVSSIQASQSSWQVEYLTSSVEKPSTDLRKVIALSIASGLPDIVPLRPSPPTRMVPVIFNSFKDPLIKT